MNKWLCIWINAIILHVISTNVRDRQIDSGTMSLGNAVELHNHRLITQKSTVAIIHTCIISSGSAL